MPLKGLIGSRGKENPSHVKFKAQLDAAISSAASGPSGPRVDPAAVEGMLALVRSKEISPGDALSCFKTYFREGTPDEQCNTLRVLIQFVGSDPHLANMLHMELASRRWRERFLHLAASPHPEVRPMLIDALQTWSASYRGHDIGMHYQSTLRELNAGPTIRPAGPGYNPQMTGYSMQTTGAYPVPPPPPGYPLPGPATGYPAPPPGYPPYGPGYPPPQMLPQASSRRAPETVAQKLEQLTSEVDVLREAIRAFEKTLADYKAQRCNFGALSAAMDKGQRSADRCTALQSQMEGLLGTSDADESLTARVFSTNDAVVAALEQWTRLANQELAPDDAPAAAPNGAPSTSAGPAASAGAGTSTAGAAPPARPPPSPIDLLLGDEIPAPTPAPAAAVPAAAAGAAASTWSAFPAPAAAAPGVDAAIMTAGVIAPPVVPASDMEGLRAQVLALAAELEKERKMHKISLETQEAFAKQELAQVKAQLQARIAELEGALAQARQGVMPSTPSVSAPSGSSQGPPFGIAGSAVAPAPVYPTLPLSPNLPAPTPPTAAPAGLSANNPFAATYTPAPSYGSLPPPPATSGGGGIGPFTSMQAPLGAPATAPARAAAPAPDFFKAFDDLAVLSPKPPAAPAPAGPPPGPAPMGSAGGSLPSAAPAAPGGAAGGSAGGAGSWVDFGL